MEDQKVKITRQRKFLPFHMLYHAAWAAHEDALSKREGYFHDQLNCMMLCAMTVEAIGNCYGAELFEDWKDYEGLKPVSKIRLIAEHFDIKYDKLSEPWSTLVWLITFRNKLAHPKFEDIDETIEVDKSEYGHHFYEKPLSKLEKTITEQNMKRAYKCIQPILELFVDKLPLDSQDSFLSDSWSGGSSH